MVPILWTDVKNSICLVYTVGHMAYMRKVFMSIQRGNYLFAEYKQNLNIEDETTAGPTDLKVSWIGEKDGMEQWPSLYFSDIS